MINFKLEGSANQTDIIDADSGKYITVQHSFAKMAKALYAYQDGALVQEAFPFLTAGEKEFIISGLTEQEFDNLFGEDDDA